ncbi:nuclear transport factor 2 family protein [Halobellus sp. GM3]|uniref:nuclear transport factor 2 family protein n=1 Tax=Halobellus sp. GM3 TaxID=3458410 RepID=UPI00403D67EF
MNGTADDLLAIQRLHHRYLYCLDAGRIDEFVDLFHEDATLALSSGDRSGHDDLRTFIRDRSERDLGESVHMAANPVVSIDGTEAEGRWYYVVAKRFDDGSGELGFGTHESTYRSADGTWKIDTMSASRLQTVEFDS